MTVRLLMLLKGVLNSSMGSKVSQPMLQHGCCCWHRTPATSKHEVLCL